MTQPPVDCGKPDSQEFKEYYFVQDIISKFNSDCLTIKQWSVTSASVVAVVGQAAFPALIPVALVVAILACSFWVTETVWRRNQSAFIHYVRELETATPGGPQVSHNWSKFYLKSDGKTLPLSWPVVMIMPQTCLPHVIILAIALLVLGLLLLFPGLMPAKASADPLKIVVEQPIQFREHE